MDRLGKIESDIPIILDRAGGWAEAAPATVSGTEGEKARRYERTVTLDEAIVGVIGRLAEHLADDPPQHGQAALERGVRWSGVGKSEVESDFPSRSAITNMASCHQRGMKFFTFHEATVVYGAPSSSESDFAPPSRSIISDAVSMHGTVR